MLLSLLLSLSFSFSFPFPFPLSLSLSFSFSVELIEPDNKVVVFDKENLSPEKSIYYIRNKGTFKIKYILQDSEHNDLYTCKFKNSLESGYLKDSNEKKFLLFKFFNNKSGESVIAFYKDDKNTHSVTCKLTSRRSTTSYSKYTVEFENKETSKTEILDIHYNNKESFIYYGKQKEDGQLICKLFPPNSLNIYYTIEIAPNVDQLFINVILCIIIRIILIHRATTTTTVII